MTGRSREGAWIEIEIVKLNQDSAQGRSREGAWIEMLLLATIFLAVTSLPRGSVD